MSDEKKIFIDEDWKAQVQREKELAKQKAEEEPPAAEEGEESAGGEQNIEASFAGLLQSLATQCLFALGLIAPPNAKEVTIDLVQAQFVIDTLAMLREKTKGNLTDEEDGALTEAISELQRAYVARAQQAQEAALKQSGVDMNNLRGE